MVEIALERGRRFWLALPRDKGPHASELAETIARDNRYFQQPHIGMLALDLLRGRGSLIDVGANLGLLALAAARTGANVVAIEPLPQNALCLLQAVQRNRLGNLIVLPLAAGDERRVAHLWGTEAWARISDDADGTPIAMLPLDDIAELVALQRGKRFLRRPLLVKIDTEGSELAVLRGMARLAEHWTPDVIIECAMIEGLDHAISRKTTAVKQLFEAHGYRLYLHRGDRLAPRRAVDIQEGHLCDFLATRRAYRIGDRIGRFTVGPLGFTESLRWTAEMAGHSDSRHRLHAVGVIARWLGDGRDVNDLAPLAQPLLADPDPAVAEQAINFLGSFVAR